MTSHRGGLQASATAAPAGLTLSPAGAAPLASALPTADQGWNKTVWIAVAMVAFVAIKIQELYPPLGLLRPSLLAAGVGTIVLVAKTPKPMLLASLSRPLPRLVLAYLFWSILTVPMALWKGGAFEGVRNLAPAILLFVAMVACAPTKKNVDTLQLWWVMLLAAFGTVGQAISISRRLGFGYTYDPNDIAALMTLGVPLAFGIAIREKKLVRIIAILSLLVFITTIVGTRSRGGVVGLLGAVVAYVLATRGNRKITVIVLITIGLAATWTMASQRFRRRISTMTNIETDYNMTDELGRKAVWTRGLGYIKQNPITGVGIANFPVAEGLALNQAGKTGKWSAAHNAYVQAYAELGIPGGTIYVLMILFGMGIGVRWARGVRLGTETQLRPEYVASLTGAAFAAIFLSHAYFAATFGLLGLIGLADRLAVEARRGRLVPAGHGSALAIGPVRRPGERGGYSFASHAVWRHGTNS